MGVGSDGKKIAVSRTAKPENAIVSVGDFAIGPGAAEKNTDRLRLVDVLSRNVERVRMVGSAAVDLAWVSLGITDAMAMLVNNPWGTAAGAVIAAEAGASVLDHLGNRTTWRLPRSSSRIRVGGCARRADRGRPVRSG